MTYLNAFNQRLSRLLPFITPTSLIIGILLAQWLLPYNFLAPWLFAFMTFAGSLKSKLSDFVKIAHHPSALLLAVGLLHIVMPLVAWLFGHVFFPGDYDVITGLVLGASIPTGITSMFWVTMLGGNVSLSLAIILLDTLLAPFVVPGSLKLLAGASLSIDVSGMFVSLLFMIVLPSLLGIAVNHFSKGRAEQTVKPMLEPFSKLTLGIVVALNGAYVAPYFKRIDWHLIGTILLVATIAITAYSLSWFLMRLLRWEMEDATAVVFSVGMRNISAGAVLATAFLPPAAGVPVVVAMLMQQLLASQVSHLISRRTQRLALISD